ncbi:MAG: shikimate dehydrogenase [Chloroflexota bacterium]
MPNQKIFYFIGVTTGQSSIMQLFPRWMRVLGREEVVIQGIDHPLNHTAEAYRKTAVHIKTSPNVLGALVTSHKVNLLAASRDLFDYLDPLAQVTQEVSCIAKDGSQLLGYAKDPITSAKAMGKIVGAGYFGRTGGEVLCLGAGGAAMATLLALIEQPNAADRPAKFTAVDIDKNRLDHMEAMAEQFESDVELNCVLSQSAAQNDALLAQLPPHSLVINATGMGKDRPGSPLTQTAVYPHNTIVWEFNYRGERPFLHHARAQATERQLTVVDGWDYFLFGWSEVIGEVLDIEITAEIFEQLKQEAERP